MLWLFGDDSTLVCGRLSSSLHHEAWVSTSRVAYVLARMSNQFNLEWLETLVVRLQKHLALWTWTLWPLPSCNRPSTPKVKAHTRDNGFSFSSASGYLKHLSWITVSRPFRLHSHHALAFHLETVRSVVMLLQNVCIMIQISLSQDDGHPKKTETMNRIFFNIFFLAYPYLM